MQFEGDGVGVLGDAVGAVGKDFQPEIVRAVDDAGIGIGEAVLGWGIVGVAGGRRAGFGEGIDAGIEAQPKVGKEVWNVGGVNGVVVADGVASSG